MPSIAQIPMSSSPAAGKKRKREQLPYANEEDQKSFSGVQFTSPTVPSRALLTTSPTNSSMTTITPPATRLLLKPRPHRSSRFHDAKRLRVSPHGSEKMNSRTIEAEFFHAAVTTTHLPACDSTVPASISDGRGVYMKIDLSPCHICHQKPKVRTDLDSYGYCEGCEKRTCYICMRECLGPSIVSIQSPDANRIGGEEPESLVLIEDGMSFTPQPLNDESAKSHTSDESLTYDGEIRRIQGTECVDWPCDEMLAWGHRGMICSQCCVERGPAGEVRCFGCLRAEKGG